MSTLHPIIVHFPVALLTLYAIFELIRFRKVLERSYWFYVKATLAIFGELGAIAAALTGPDVQGSKLVEMHSFFAGVTVGIFALLSLSYLVEWVKRSEYAYRIPSWLSKASARMQRGIVLAPLAFLGLAAVVITGGLGGAIVYGTQFDPFMAPIFKLLGVY